MDETRPGLLRSAHEQAPAPHEVARHRPAAHRAPDGHCRLRLRDLGNAGADDDGIPVGDALASTERYAHVPHRDANDRRDAHDRSQPDGHANRVNRGRALPDGCAHVDSQSDTESDP